MSKMIFNEKIIKILEAFSSDYSKRVYGREISRKFKMNQKTISNILNKLEKENILKFTSEGKNKYYYLNKFNPRIKEIIKLIEISRKSNFLDKNKNKQELFEKIEKRTKGVAIIFGSYSKNQANEKSDLDLFVMGSIEDLGDLEQLYNIKINLIKSNAKKFNPQEHIIQEIINNHIILKGIEEFIGLIWKI